MPNSERKKTLKDDKQTPYIQQHFIRTIGESNRRPMAFEMRCCVMDLFQTFLLHRVRNRFCSIFTTTNVSTFNCCFRWLRMLLIWIVTILESTPVEEKVCRFLRLGQDTTFPNQSGATDPKVKWRLVSWCWHCLVPLELILFSWRLVSDASATKCTNVSTCCSTALALHIYMFVVVTCCGSDCFEINLCKANTLHLIIPTTTYGLFASS